MSIHRRAAQRDKNEPEIVEALRNEGYFVTPLSGEGVPDLLVIDPHPTNPVYICRTPEEALMMTRQSGRRITLIEVKSLTGKLRDAQKDWFKNALSD